MCPNGTSIYQVRLGRRGNLCECADSEFHDGPCKHIHAAPFARAKTFQCGGCANRFLNPEHVEALEDHLTFFEGDPLCRDCAIYSGGDGN